MPSEEGEPADPTDLRYVGPATAPLIERAHFDAADIRERTVSYADLMEAGVNPGVAAKLRREYSLVWSNQWVAGADLNRRAALVGGLDPDQREWIAASPSTKLKPETAETTGERAWRDRADWLKAESERPRVCERCGGPLVTYEMGEQNAVHCESCGYAGLSIRP